MFLQQPALQAALAAQCMAAQVQSKSSLLPQQMMQLLPKMSPPPPLGSSKEPVSQSLAVDQTVTPPTSNNTPVTSQELSVAQMMMTLAQASSNKNIAHDGNSTTANAQQHAPNSNNND